jgi:hypothetical protein
MPQYTGRDETIDDADCGSGIRTVIEQSGLLGVDRFLLRVSRKDGPFG